MSVLARLATKHPWLVITGWVILLIASVGPAAQLDNRVSNGGYSVPGSGSQLAAQAQEENFATAGREIVLVVGSSNNVHRAELRSSVNRAAGRLEQEDAVSSVGSPQLSHSGKTAIVPVMLRTDLGETQRQIAPLRERLGQDGSRGVELVGRAPVFDASTQIAQEDLRRSEQITLPITLLILLFAFLTPVAAGLPLLLSLFSLVVTFASLALLATVIDMSVFVTNTATLLGLGLSIDYSLFMVSRYREVVAKEGLRTAGAIEATLQTTGRAILLSGLTVAISLASLLAVGIDIYSSMAIGASVAATMAALTALTLVPALICVLGSWIDRLSLRPAARAASKARLWHWLSDFVLNRRALVAASTVAILLIAAIPLTSLKISFPTTSVLLPGKSDIRTATDRVAREFGRGSMTPINVLTKAEPRRVRSIMDGDRGILRTLAPVKGENGWSQIHAIPLHEENTPEANATARRVRDALENKLGASTFVGGQTMEGIDLTDRIGDRFLVVVAVAVILSLALLFIAFRSVVVPIKAVMTNLLSVSGTLGVLVVAFQWFGEVGSLAHFVPLFLFALIFGLSMDYEIFLLSRVREEYLSGASNDDAVKRGMIRSGRPITLAALVIITVFLASASSRLQPFQQLGVGLSLAIFIDATIVRCLLVPSVMALLGDRNWWAPAFLAGSRARPYYSTTNDS